jgi:RNA ligase (TIGR02306 family)
MKLATIERIHSINPHPNPEVERLEIGKVKNWPVVIPKGEYSNGDLVVFIQIDSIVPKENPAFAFMERQKYRVWNARFKGAPSSGLVMKLRDFNFTTEGNPHLQVNEGDDVTEIIGVTKYEKPLDLSLNGEARGNFPTNLIPITDEDNINNYVNALHELDGMDVYITVKADGSSCTVINDNGVIRVCSRRLEQKEGTGFWKIIEQYDLANKMLDKKFTNIAIQCECVGPKLNGNRMGLTQPEIRVFNVRNIATGEWFSWSQTLTLCSELGIPNVELVMSLFKWDCSIHTTETLQAIADSVKYGDKPGEGIVLRPVVPFWSPSLNKMWSVKILNQDYKQ